VLHRSGERPWRSSSQQLRLKLVDKYKKISYQNVISKVRKQTSTEHGEEKLQMKEPVYVYAREWI